MKAKAGKMTNENSGPAAMRSLEFTFRASRETRLVIR
jgi:hypothetical protein